ncbi:MAG: carboxymuconolactone decarboxylase family protein [Solirubrobacteraceae bacterium]|nr:carboxymuconolactone decarboxylase family protein [Solirubrobacteraceae bacterium]
MSANRNLVADLTPTSRPEWNGLVPRQLYDRLNAEPVVGRPIDHLGKVLLDAVDGRTSELVALRVAALRGCLYVWAGHCQIALRRPDGRLTKDEIARVAAGPAMFDGADAAVVAAADAILAHASTRIAEPAAMSPVTMATLVLFYDLICTIMADAEPDAAPVRGLETPARAAAAALAA